LHDIGREKQFKNQNICHAQIGGIMAKEFLLKNNWPDSEAEHINKCISSHRFRGDNIPETIEAKILFDSDKLDVRLLPKIITTHNLGIMLQLKSSIFRRVIVKERRKYT
jgi:HD superfamily phosphodiesterase